MFYKHLRNLLIPKKVLIRNSQSVLRPIFVGKSSLFTFAYEWSNWCVRWLSYGFSEHKWRLSGHYEYDEQGRKMLRKYYTRCLQKIFATKKTRLGKKVPTRFQTHFVQKSRCFDFSLHIIPQVWLVCPMALVVSPNQRVNLDGH